MNTQDSVNYKRVEEAIEYIQKNFKSQPGLEEIAKKINLSPFHFQRLFTEWAGVSPKAFLHYLTIGYAKSILKEKEATLFDVAYKAGLSGTGRLHDLFVKIEGMTPGEWKNGGADLTINYNFYDSPFGAILIASTSKGICQMAFADDEESAFAEIRECFPNAVYIQVKDAFQQSALTIFTRDWRHLDEIKLHLKGTAFQHKVWEALLKIPVGHLSSYAGIAASIGNPKASRAVGSAIGDNPVAFLVPCHRVIQSVGTFGKYHWGSARKAAIIGWEAATSTI